MKKLLSILALALCFVACQNEGVENPTNGDLATVVLSVDAPELGVTRADEDNFAGKNSAYGAIDFFNDADWDNYDLRYILEVYDANDEGTGEPIYRERLVNCLDKYAPTQFDLRLVPNRDYKFVVFADFVAEGSAEAEEAEDKLAIRDLYYNTADLRNISAITAEPTWNAMNEVRDAYFVSKNLSVNTSLNETLTLTRPFAKLRVIATDLDYIAGYSAPGYVEVTYHTEALYKSFNAVNGKLNETQLAGEELEYAFDVNKNIPYTKGYDAEAKCQTLFADYLFAHEGQQIPVNFKMAVYESKGGRLIKETDFNTQIPVQRNHLTTMIGDILTTEANITVKVDDKFVDEWVNPTMLTTPEVSAKVESTTVTLSWEAVKGATKYFTRIAADGNTFEETTELTKVYADLEWETEYTFEVYAMENNGIASKVATVTATTEKEPVALATPVVKAEVAVNVITLTWEAVENAGQYGITVGTEMPVFVEDTTYVFTGEYETEYTFNVVAVPEDEDKFAASEAAVVKVTTEAEPVVTPTETKLYFQPNSNWKVDNARFAAYFFGNGETWEDLTLVEGETDIYELTLPAGYPNIIFCRMNPTATANNWNNKWNQTADLVVPTDGKNLFILASGSWDGASTSWSTYTPAVVEPETPAVVYTTVAEFLALTDVVPSDATADEIAAAPLYTLKGTITSVTNTSYGNFYLNDGTGEVLIYGLVGPNGEQKYWATSGAMVGDDITVKTIRTEYGNSPQGKNATFVEVNTPGTLAFYTVDSAAVDFASAGGDQDIEVYAYNTTAGVTATSDNAAFTVAVNGYVVTVTAAANELEEAVTGNITIKVGDLEPTVVKATIAAKPASGAVEGGSDDFHTISATNTSYVTGKTTAGWNYKNCAIFKGGTSDSSPAFKMIGDAANRALCMNGKTSAVGSITSPTLTTGCGTLKFNYGLPFSDTKIKFRVDIIQNGAVVKTFTVDKSSASKVTKYSHEEEINVAGEFQIVFTNLSPSNSTSNKDRTAIWDVEWTGYNN